MRAELVIDLHRIGAVVGDAIERGDRVLPSLGKIASLWNDLGVDVTTVHVIMPGYSLRSSAMPSEDELRARTWWETESVFLEDEDFTVEIHHSAVGDDGFVGHDALVVTTALRRSDELAAESEDESMVIVMSSERAVAPAVRLARGVPVMLAGTQVIDPGLAHALLDPEWFGSFATRLTEETIEDVEIRGGHPWRDGQAISTPYCSLHGRDDVAATLPTFTESAVVFDPDHFHVLDDEVDATPTSTGVASVVQLLGLGELVHVTTALEEEDDPLVETTLVATIYRLAADNPELPIIVASNRPGVVVAMSDLSNYSLDTARRFLRLCLPFRESSFDERAFSGKTTAPRVLLERSLSEPLFAEDDASVKAPPIVERDDDRSSSPTLVLFTNPNSAREDSVHWRESTGRRFLELGAGVLEARPADHPDEEPLPVSLGGCTDFSVRRPDLQPGAVVEGILDTERQRWIVVSDPIERRAVARAAAEAPREQPLSSVPDAA